jgi:hypothetical protein
VARSLREELMAWRASTPLMERDPTFSLAERTVVGLYDAGVLSPAVLQHVLLAFMSADIDWGSAPVQRTVDGRSIHEVVATTMMPGRTTRSPSKDFLSVVEHLRGTSLPLTLGQTVEEPPDQEDDELLDQLGGGTAKRNRAVRPSRKAQPSAGFNPLFHATSPNRKAAK